ncbi:hypothetical protein [Celeribacter sp.]|uniref:hypothetical protein n=1 Tax=Celeribacter sp. TaxID=1890673 RepID=UPI003A910CC5
MTTSKPANPTTSGDKSDAPKGAEKRAVPPKSKEAPKRQSIFDTSFAPEGAERRKQWTRFDPKRK